jgi:restriction system protein
MFGGKKKFQEELARAQAEFATAHWAWQTEAGQIPMRQFEQMEGHRKAEEVRRAQLEAEMATYRDECAQRQRKVDEDNAELDRLIQDLAAGKPDAVEEYIGIVLVNSAYPDGFPGVANYKYDAVAHELVVSLQFPSPDQIPSVKQYKYVKAKDEIAETPQTQKEQRERYSNVVNNMTLRTLHEMWESDHAGHIGTISLTGFVEHIDPATGKEVQTPLVALATERERFLDIDLSRVTPSETLRHLDANLSKNPHGLVGIDLGQGVRGH